MTSSGMKRGLAALAVSAVAVTGIPALASANTVDSQVTGAIGATSVQLYNATGLVGVEGLTAKNDGTDATVRLEAGAGQNVPGVIFQANRNGGVFFDIGTVTSRNDDGAFSLEWTPSANGVFPGDSVEIRVRNAADPNNAVLGDDLGGALPLLDASANSTQAINIAEGSQKGYWAAPGTNLRRVGITGTTTVLGNNGPHLRWMDGNGAALGSTFSSSNGGDNTFEGVLQFNTGTYTFDDPALPPVEADQLVVRAVTDALPAATQDNTDDFEAFTLYQQTLTSLTATITPRTEPDPGLVTVTVMDQNSAPIAGIEVYDAADTLIGTTNGRGQVTTPQSDMLDYFYANATVDAGFSPADGDKRSNDVNNQAAVVDITTSPSDGNVPVGTTVTETIKVTDPSGDPISNRPVRIKREGPQDGSETKFATTNDNGEVTYTFTCTVEGVAQLEIGIRGPNPIPPNDDYTWAVGCDTVNCKNPTPPQAINVKLRGKSSGGKDILTVDAPSIAKGATAVLQKKVKGKWVQVGKAKKLDGAGNRQWGTKDRNGSKVTKYRAIVSGNSKVLRDVSPVKRQR